MFKFEKSWAGSYHLTIGNKVNFFLGRRSLLSPGIGIELSVYDRSLMISLIFFYVGVEVYYSE